MAHDVFISYANEDQRVADAVCEALEAGGIRCWYAPRDIPYLVDYEEAIIDGISQSKLMLLILSEHANNSPHVKREVQNACREEPQIPVLPFQIADVPLSKSFRYYLGSVHWLVASTPPQEAHLQRLVDYVQRRLPQPERDGDSGTQSDQPAQTEIIKKDEEEALQHAEEALRLAEEVERRRIEEEERLAAEREAERKAEEERQRTEAEENRRAEEEETQRRLAAEVAAQRAAEDRQLEEEEERRRFQAEQAARQQAEEERVRAEVESRERAEQEAERLRVEAEQEAERGRLEEEKQAPAEEETLHRAEAARQAEEAGRQRGPEQALRVSHEEEQTTPPDLPAVTTTPISRPTVSLYDGHATAVAGATPLHQSKNKRTMMLVIIGSAVIITAIALIWIRQASQSEQGSVNNNSAPLTANPASLPVQTAQSPTGKAEEGIATVTPQPSSGKEESKRKEENVASNPAVQPPENKNASQPTPTTVKKKDQALYRASRAKSYLVNNRGVDSSRIIIRVKGNGEGEAFKTELLVGGRLFDSYGNVAWGDEQARLDNFVVTLMQDPGATGSIIVTGR
jgi:TIR domain